MIYIIRVLQVISGNDNGGGAKHVLNICKNDIFDMESWVVCIGRGYMYDNAVKEDIKVKCFTFREMFGKKFLEYISKNKINIVDFHGAKSNFLYFLIHKSINVLCTSTVHSDFRYDFLNNKLKKYLYTPLSRAGLLKFDNYICVSESIKNLLDDNGFRGHKYIVGNGIDIRNVEVSVTVKDIRRSFNIDEDDFVYVMVARMHPVKNHEKLIKAFYILQKENPHVKLVLVGDGKLQERLTNIVHDMKIEDKVIFAGFRENAADFINMSDISVLTSFNEGGSPPIVILESAILRKPVICSKISNIESIVKPENGYLVNPEDENDIFLAMKKAYLNRDKLKNMGVNLYECIRKNFSLEEFWKKYYSAYLNMLGGVR